MSGSVSALSTAPALERTGNPSLVLPDVLRALYAGRRTGILHVMHGDERVSFSLVDGEILNGSSTSHKGRLGETMVRYGLLGLQDLVRALVVVHRDKRRLGPVLKEMGAIDTHRLEQALVLHRREMLVTALGWEEAAHVFENQEPAADRNEDLARPCSTGKLILEVVQRISSRELVCLGLGNLDRIPGFVPDPRFRIDRITLRPAETYLLSRVDGRVSARSIIETSPLPAEDVERSLLGLLSTGVIEYLAARAARPSYS